MADCNNGSEYSSESTRGPNGDHVEAKELEQLSAKIAEFVQEAALAFKRIAKDHEEIEHLKAETRAILKSFRAA
jgi:uncharacterized membrane-anchored protein